MSGLSKGEKRLYAGLLGQWRASKGSDGTLSRALSDAVGGKEGRDAFDQAYIGESVKRRNTGRNTSTSSHTGRGLPPPKPRAKTRVPPLKPRTEAKTPSANVKTSEGETLNGLHLGVAMIIMGLASLTFGYAVEYFAPENLELRSFGYGIGTVFMIVGPIITISGLVTFFRNKRRT